MKKAMLVRAVTRMCIAVCGLSVANQTLHAQKGPGSGYENIPDGAYSVVAEVQAKAGKADALRVATLPLIQQVRSDPKNLVYFLQEAREKPGHFVFYEVFATKEDFEQHNNQPYVKAWFSLLPELAEGGVTVTRLQVLASH